MGKLKQNKTVKVRNMDKIPEVEKGLSINDLIKEVNGIIDGWTGIYKPITSGRKDTLDATNMADGGANINTAIMGLVVTMVADLNMTKEDIMKQITIIDESPFVKVEAVDKYMKVYNSIKDWIMAYVDINEKTQEFIDKIEALPDKA